MFKTLLLPVDLTDKHQAALKTVAELAQQTAGEVILLHVIEYIVGVDPNEEAAFYKRLERLAQKHLDGLGVMLTEQKVRWRCEIRIGHRPAEITRFAAEAGADLTIVTCPRFQVEDPTANWGSMSWKLSVLSPCPILLVK